MNNEKTLRDEFAMAVLPVLLADRNGSDEQEIEAESLSGYVRSTATASYMFADAMIEARKK